MAEAAIRGRVCAQDKIDVNGEGAHPLYKFLRAQQPVSQPSSKITDPTTTMMAIISAWPSTR